MLLVQANSIADALTTYRADAIIAFSHTPIIVNQRWRVNLLTRVLGLSQSLPQTLQYQRCPRIALLEENRRETS